ncbi:MAG: NAD(P)-dependent oxidoreductase [Pseudomonadota bacterium]
MTRKGATIVIGGGGFVGLNIVEHLLSEGRDVTLLDVTAPPQAALDALTALPGALTVALADVCEPGAIAGAMPPETETMVYGAAVTASFARDRDAPERTIAVNLDGFLQALRAAQGAGLRRVINLSSAGAYGAAAFRGTGPLREDDPVDPQNIYGITKFASERLAGRMAEVWGIDTISLRLSGVFGRWERRTGVRDTPSPQFQIVEALRAHQPALIERTDARDWIYAPDVARVVARLLDSPKLAHRLYNVSTGMTWSVLDWGQAMAQTIPGGVCRLAAPGETANVALHAKADRRPLDISRAQAEIGPLECCGIEQSVADYAEWGRQTGKVYT